LDKSSIGKKSRASGKKFELDVRKDLTEKGYVVCKWTNIVDITEDKIIPAKSKYNPFTKRTMSEGSGFPDFIAFKKVYLQTPQGQLTYFSVIGVESKKAKYLDAKERRIAKWYLEHETFSKMYVAYPLKDKMSDKRRKGIAYYKLEKEKMK
jgi:hypothetical protein